MMANNQRKLTGGVERITLKFDDRYVQRRLEAKACCSHEMRP
jgi:hypothetical protein